MSASPDLVVIGAGPAGMSGAIAAAAIGLSVVVLDERPALGGNAYAVANTTAPAWRRLIGASARHGAALIAEFRRSRIDYRPGSAVWMIGPGPSIEYLRDGVCETLAPRAVLVATGGMERPWPVPGWTLPGVMTASAALHLLKAAGLGAAGAVFAGSGPLLLLAAALYARAGVPIAAVLETAPPARRGSALARLPLALAAPGELIRLAALRRTLRRAGVRHLRGVAALRATGGESLSGVAFRTAGGAEETIATQHLFLHQGVVPETGLVAAAGVALRWHGARRCFVPVADSYGRTGAGLWLAGDAGDGAGAQAALIAGRIAAIDIATRLGTLPAARTAPVLRKLVWRRARGRAALPFAIARDAAPDLAATADEVVVCRCEGVTAGAIRDAARLGVPGPNQLKAFTRCGMGACQGRQCGLAAVEILAAALGRPPGEIGPLRARPPLRPVTLGALAGPAEWDEAMRAG